MAWTSRSARAAMAWLVAGALLPAVVRAQPQQFEIAAGPASAALEAFSRQADVNLLASGELLQGVRTQALRGRFEVGDALQRLLAESGLEARPGSPGTFFIVRQPERLPPPSPEDTAIPDVVVMGARSSQQSSMVQKRYADTAVDVVVAQDVGSFPDRNVGEAVSRIAGVALDRGDYGEGVSVGLRGVGPDMTRVEIDGLGVAGAGGAALLGPDDRSVEFRELPSDMIKTVEVRKGATAADTEGGLAGSILIHTRSGLDFDQRYLSGRVAATGNSLSHRWGPDLNLVYADRLLDGRLGVAATLNGSHTYNESHRQDLSVNGGSGPSLLWDFDQSPEKTFAYNPATLSATDPAVNAPVGSSPYALTPREIVTRSAAAQTKADCYTAMPALSAAQLEPLAGIARRAAVNQRTLELMSCLTQWNDYTPTNVRSIVRRQDDRRSSADLRVDFKVNHQLRLFAKATRQERLVWDTFLTQSLGNMTANSYTNTPAYAGATYVDDALAGTRTPVAGSGYHVLPGVSYGASGALSGVITNVDPATVVVDGAHHVVGATIADGALATEKELARISTRNNYLQLGGSYRDGRWRADFFVGRVASDFLRESRRVSLGYSYGPVSMQRLGNGLWSYAPAPGVVDGDGGLAGYGALTAQAARAAVAASVNTPGAPAYGAEQLPLVGQGVQTWYTPRAAETRENSGKIDFSYALGGLVADLRAIRFGAQRRDYSNRYWDSNGYQVSPAQGTFGAAGYVAPVIVPSPRLRDSGVSPCLDTAGSLGAGGLPCAYGYTAGTTLLYTRDGRSVMTPQQFAGLLSQVLQARGTPTALAGGGYDIDVMKLFTLAGIRNDQPDCLKSCVGSDGQRYAQPLTALSEKVDAAYVMAEFSSERLPWAIRVDGNVGLRYVRTRVAGTGLLTISAQTRNAAFDPAQPGAAAGVDTTVLSQLTTLQRGYVDYLPSLNAAAWLRPDQLVLRYNVAKMVGRPKVSQLVPSGACNYDERLAAAGQQMSCSGTLGNPELKPWVSWNQNYALEYYPDRDTMLSFGHYRQRGTRGAPVAATLEQQAWFQGSGAVVPSTGQSLGDYRFSVPTLINGPGISRLGWELGGKMALSFLPGLLRHTGLDFNASWSRPHNNDARYRDLNSGEVLPALLEPHHSYNLSVWYDDGAFSARAALQVVGERLYCIAPCGNLGAAQNYPADGATRILLPYMPGLPVFGRETRYVDVRLAYRLRSGIELFADVRNLGKTVLQTDTGKYAVYEDGVSNLLGAGYGGVRMSAGLIFRY